MRKIFYIDLVRSNARHAGIKAPKDISEICRQNGYVRFEFPRFPNNKSRFYERLWLLTICPLTWLKLSGQLSTGDIVIYQHPMYGVRVAERMIPLIQKRKHGVFIGVIHDLESLRKEIANVDHVNEKTSQISDNILLKHFNMLICHNEKMRKYLIQKGFDGRNIVCLGIFDYLCCDRERPFLKGEHSSIAIAGNLAFEKSGYLYHIFEKNKNSKLTVHLYGTRFEEGRRQEGMIYHGSFEPEELPTHLEGDFGLVWDGTSAETCAGNTGEYLKYNNPHKTSLYFASGMPVIVWSQSAMADFVRENGVGVVVDSLYGLDEMLAGISIEDYRIMCKNVSEIGKKIRSGFYFTTAFKRCMDILEKE